MNVGKSRRRDGSTRDAGFMIVQDLGGCQNTRIDCNLVKSTFKKLLRSRVP